MFEWTSERIKTIKDRRLPIFALAGGLAVSLIGGCVKASEACEDPIYPSKVHANVPVQIKEKDSTKRRTGDNDSTFFKVVAKQCRVDIDAAIEGQRIESFDLGDDQKNGCFTDEVRITKEQFLSHETDVGETFVFECTAGIKPMPK